ncbi:MAG: hypothetical protein B7X69_07155 [Sulfurovum sp. 39-42-12]|nr:MAG: hypothetical protein B7X69_07155 [Sulfurovum sp. 39-42-12]
MKHLRGHRKNYFKLAVIALYSTLANVIALYSTLAKLCWIDSNFQYHKKAFIYHEYKTSPPCLSLFY